MPPTPATRSAPSSKTSTIAADCIRHCRIDRRPSSKQTCNSLRPPPSDPRLLPMQPVPSFVSHRRGAVHLRGALNNNEIYKGREFRVQKQRRSAANDRKQQRTSSEEQRPGLPIVG